MATIQLQDVFKYYGDIEAVKNLNLRCHDGEMMALLGPSGCGKSSTLKMVAGIEEVSRGEIFFDDSPVNNLAPNERNIAMVFEDYALYPHLTVFENIAFPLKLRKLAKREIRQRVSAILDLLGLADTEKQDVKSLSGGAQQRISIGRALVRDPELILFDEPLSHLDANQRVMLRAEIKRLQQTTGLTAILVTHDQTEAMAMADRVAVMNLGVLQQVDSPETLYERPANLFVANFIGEPPMNLLPVKLNSVAEGLRLEGGSWFMNLNGELAQRVTRASDSQDIVIGIRPEHTEVGNAGEPIQGRVMYHESRGDVTMFVLEVGRSPNEHRLAVEVPVDGVVLEDETVAVRFPEDKLHFFDTNSGENLLLRNP
jgi:ABC-type sugar transport system ATPase subunit